jgi:hypothetical protein
MVITMLRFTQLDESTSVGAHVGSGLSDRERGAGAHRGAEVRRPEQTLLQREPGLRPQRIDEVVRAAHQHATVGRHGGRSDHSERSGQQAQQQVTCKPTL